MTELCWRSRRRKWLLTILIVFLQSLTVEGCGPGRGGIRRRGSRKITPLVYKQHVPNYSERSLAASGLPEGLVDRSNPKFRQLVANYNNDIIFKDEEGTGADRLMTPRCKEKLNTLAISVMNQWPGVQLRVTEAWDEDAHHADKSLHYEGRAVDFTTSDRDRKKYGLLARLAVESGFDWVYYESRAHIHASCKSEAAHPSKSGGCFSANSTVMMSDGSRKRLSELQIGDTVLSVNSASGELEFSPVILFLDRQPTEVRQFYSLLTENGHSLTLTPEHLIFSHFAEDASQAEFEAVYAKDVQEGDFVLVSTGKGQLEKVRVTQVEMRVLTGVYAPLTSAGNLVVDNVVASCYAVVDSQNIAHAAFAPLRWASHLYTTNEITTGIHWYARALYSIAEAVMPRHLQLP